MAGIELIPAPLPVPVEATHREWETAGHAPVMTCVPAWSAACEAWWHDPHDTRLRDRTLAGLFLDADELATWTAAKVDLPMLLRAHAHVTSQRAGHERDVVRDLSTGALRTVAVLSEHRGGARTVFVPAREVPDLVANVGRDLEALPDHPFVRAAWLTQALGAIHPFHDANGGTSRFLASLQLARAWLPPLTLTPAQRNGPYIDGLMRSNRTGLLDLLSEVVYEVVQTGLADALLAGAGSHAAWDDGGHARAARWGELADAAVRAGIGAPLVDTLTSGEVAPTEGVARLLQRGFRFPLAPTPRCTQWSLTAPMPVRFDLSITPVRGGPVVWVIAVLGASIGRDGVLGAVPRLESVVTTFVAPMTEAEVVCDGRFQQWIERRVDQCVRGLAAWM